MTERSLQVTYRKGRPFAAYLHLSHPTGEKSVVGVMREVLTVTTSSERPQPSGLTCSTPAKRPKSVSVE